ncbi:hypothetical protein VUJ46_01275 [Chryseobacterium sp. MYb264]|uniref:hypothetical protein n=1 Tax=Chryseobacterium sp. MYb264 TaxID=2745153 RepID=UPI002E12C23C|nr:hypothetical protein VUJ46_01275 [Chryseobacterium sp. MYb264]
MEEILLELKISNELISLYKGNIPIIDEYSMYKFYLNEDKSSSFPHPPFIIPFMYSYDADHYHIGIVKHWFNDRPLTFGDMTDGSAFATTEIAKTEKQLFNRLLFNEFVNNEDCKVTDRLVQCKQLMGLHDLNFGDLEKINSIHFDNAECYVDALIENPPLSCIADEERYKGDFPANESIVISSNLANACYFEIFHKEWIGYNTEKKGFSLFRKESKYKPLENIPEWLRPDVDKKELFENYMEKRDFGKAWLTINGPGFNPIEVGERLQRLKEFSNEKGFHLWVDFWCEKYGKKESFIFI